MCAFVRFLKIFDVRIFVRLLAKICAHLSLELLDTLPVAGLANLLLENQNPHSQVKEILTHFPQNLLQQGLIPVQKWPGHLDLLLSWSNRCIL